VSEEADPTTRRRCRSWWATPWRASPGAPLPLSNRQGERAGKRRHIQSASHRLRNPGLTTDDWSDDQTVQSQTNAPTRDSSSAHRFETVRKVRRYEQVADQIRRLISNGTLKTGDLLPRSGSWR